MRKHKALKASAAAGNGGEPSGECADDLVLDPLPGVCDLGVGIDRDFSGRGLCCACSTGTSLTLRAYRFGDGAVAEAGDSTTGLRSSGASV